MFDLTPFRRMSEDLFDQMEKSFNQFFDTRRNFGTLDVGLNSFRTDVLEEEDAFYVVADLPGFTKDDITIELEDNRLTIRAKRDEQLEQKDEAKHFLRKERRYGEFVRSFYVDNIKQDEIRAKLENGVLRVKLPKLEPSKPHRKTIDIE